MRFVGGFLFCWLFVLALIFFFFFFLVLTFLTSREGWCWNGVSQGEENARGGWGGLVGRKEGSTETWGEEGGGLVRFDRMG